MLIIGPRQCGKTTLARHFLEGEYFDLERPSDQDIFIDNIGTPVFRGTLRVLARQGVITTAGWKCGMEMSLLRAVECIKRHIHVFTHFARHSEGVEAVSYAEAYGWISPDNNKVYEWEDIPQLAHDYDQNRLDSYFPLFAVNPE